MDYVIITTAKNEGIYIGYTIESVCNQTVKPKEWVIVDDNSTDDTSLIIKKYSKDYPWIKLFSIDDGISIRDGGVRLVHIWNSGYKSLQTSKYDFLVRLDADLTLPENYFEEISKCFQNNPSVGLCGGYIWNKFPNGKLVKEIVASHHVRGAFKAYRKRAFEEIGGFPLVLNWDGLEEMKLMFLGWQTRTLPLDVIHHRPTSTETNKGLKSALHAGKEYYLEGNDPFLALCKSIIFGFKSKPRYISGLFFSIGFLVTFFKKQEKHVDRDLEKFIRHFQYERMFNILKLGKTKKLSNQNACE